MLKQIYKEAKMFLEVFNSSLPSSQVAIMLLGKSFYQNYKHLYEILEVDIFEESHSPSVGTLNDIKIKVEKNIDKYEQLAMIEDDEEDTSIS